MTRKFLPLSPTATVRRYRRNLPHWRVAGATYFVTYRTADSLPPDRLQFLKEQRALWLRLHPPPWSVTELDEYHRHRFRQLDRWLDSGSGSCPLKNGQAAAEVERTLRFFDGQHYDLDRFAVMPNHVHALVLPCQPWELEDILQNWKSCSAHFINAVLGRSGRLWLDENYDRIVRTVEELQRIREYIVNNPVQANLDAGTYRVGCGRGIKV